MWVREVLFFGKGGGGGGGGEAYLLRYFITDLVSVCLAKGVKKEG